MCLSKSKKRYIKNKDEAIITISIEYYLYRMITNNKRGHFRDKIKEFKFLLINWYATNKRNFAVIISKKKLFLLKIICITYCIKYKNQNN